MKELNLEPSQVVFVGNGDNLTVSVTYVDKNGTKRNLGGTI